MMNSSSLEMPDAVGIVTTDRQLNGLSTLRRRENTIAVGASARGPTVPRSGGPTEPPPIVPTAAFSHSGFNFSTKPLEQQRGPRGPRHVLAWVSLNDARHSARKF